MREIRNRLRPALLAIALAAVLGISGVAGAQQYYGGGQSGDAPGWMMGPGMTGYGYGRRGYYRRPPQTNLDLSVGQVKSYLQQWIEAGGNPHLKVGSVVAKNAGTIIAEIVTDKGAPVERPSVNRQTGGYGPIALK